MSTYYDYHAKPKTGSSKEPTLTIDSTDPRAGVQVGEDTLAKFHAAIEELRRNAAKTTVESK